MNEFQFLSGSFTAFALSIPRLGAAFLVLPLLTGEILPPLVRNVFLVSLAIAVFPLITDSVDVNQIHGVGIVPVLMKEVFIGIVLGYSFGIIFWALEGAGEVIDTKVGSTTAQIVDPLLGHQTTLIGAFLSRLTAYLFVALGGLLVFLKLLLTSYVVWPVSSKFPILEAPGQDFFILRFDEMMAMILLLAAPALLVLTLVEFGLGFVNRYASQLNVFSLSISLKGLLAVFVLLLMLSTIVQYVAGWFDGQQDLLQILKQVLDHERSK